jgi:putative membrane protein
MSEPRAGDGDKRRTSLALERTQLAWWRTGLTALAVGIGIGRVVPELQDGQDNWPYVALGVGYALYGIALIAFGTARERYVSAELSSGEAKLETSRFEPAMAIGGIALGVATALLILLG